MKAKPGNRASNDTTRAATRRVYISGRGFITSHRLIRMSMRNQHHLVFMEPLRSLTFRTDYGVGAIGLCITEAWVMHDKSIGIRGFVTSTDEEFEGSFTPRIAAGYVNITPRTPVTTSGH